MTSTKSASHHEENVPGSSFLQSVRLSERHVRMLRVAVIVMGVLIVGGLITVIARIGYLVTRSGPSVQVQSEALAPDVRAALPAGAQIRQIALDGNRLAIHYDTPAGSGIAILDVGSGRSLSRIMIVPEPPR